MKVKNRISFVPPLFKASTSSIPVDCMTASNLDLHRYFGTNRTDVFLIEIEGNYLCSRNIFEGDIVVVVKTNEICSGDLVSVDFQGVTKLMLYIDDQENTKSFLSIETGEIMKFGELGIQILGVVKHVIRNLN